MLIDAGVEHGGSRHEIGKLGLPSRLVTSRAFGAGGRSLWCAGRPPLNRVGTGLEAHLGGNMYLSPSVDFGAILGADHKAGELRRALSVGIGLILR